MKKLLWISHFVPYPPKGGLLIRSYNLLAAACREYEVHLYCLIQPKLIAAYFDSIEIGLTESEKHLKEVIGVREIKFFNLDNKTSKLGQVKSIIKAWASITPYSYYWLNSRKLTEFLAKECETADFELIHIDTSGLLSNFDIRDLKSKGSKVLVNHHNAEADMMSTRARRERNLLKKFVFKIEAKLISKFDRDYIRQATANITCSSYDKSKLLILCKDYPPKSIFVVPNSVALRPKVERNPIAGKLLFVGGLDWYPNASAMKYFIAEVWPSLTLNIPTISLDIIGKNPSIELIELAQKYDNITIHGYVKSLEKFYEQAMLFICPIFDGGGTKLKVLDAMNFGLPVIGNQFTFDGIDVEDGANCIFAETPQDYLKTILGFMEKPDQLKAIGNESRKLIEEKYSSEKAGALYTAALAHALEDK